MLNRWAVRSGRCGQFEEALSEARTVALVFVFEEHECVVPVLAADAVDPRL